MDNRFEDAQRRNVDRTDPTTGEWLVGPGESEVANGRQSDLREHQPGVEESDWTKGKAATSLPHRTPSRDPNERLRRFFSLADEVDTHVRELALRAANAAESIGRLAVSNEQPGSQPQIPPSLLELNSASMDRLRGLGLTSTQAARLIARRNALGAFVSLDQLDQLPGFPDALRDELKQRARSSDPSSSS